MEGTIGEIRFFAGNFAPKNWALCQGQLLAITQNTALFSILGTTYGGNGQTTFALPNFQSRCALGPGQGPGLSPRSLGEMSGSETFTVLQNNLPTHTHAITGTVTMNANPAEGNADAPQNSYPATQSGTPLYATATNGSLMGAMQSTLAIGSSGAQIPAGNWQPFLGLNFVICMFGVFPARN